MLAEMLDIGVTMAVVTPLLTKARRSMNVVEEGTEDKGKKKPRCMWWNRGYCCERSGWPGKDYQDHLNGGCSTRGCNLRHRR